MSRTVMVPRVKADEDRKKDGRDLSWTDGSGNTYRFHEKPLLKACSFILLQESCERLAFYGLTPTIKAFLRNKYKFSDANALTFTMLFQGFVYISAIASAIVSDTFLGTYKTILAFSAIYWLGLVLVDIAALDDAGQLWMLYVGLWGLVALGSGGIKSCVSVLGGQQYSPLCEKEQVTTFFTFFYASINVGAIIGGFVTPLVCKDVSYFWGYMIPVVAFTVATLVLMFGSRRFVMIKPQGSVVLKVFSVIGASFKGWSLEKCRKSRGGKFDDYFIDDARSLFSLIPFFSLTIPFNLCYYQIFTGFESQSAKMSSVLFGWTMPHEWMVNIDPISVIIGAFVVDTFIFPFLRRKNMMPTIMYRFVIGFVCAFIANLCALGVEYIVMGQADKTVSIWLQVPQYAFIAFGEIFVISTSYEVAFAMSPESLKAVASAMNLVAFAVAAFVGGALVKCCTPWFNDNHYDYFYIVLISVCACFGPVCYFLNGHFEAVFARAEEYKRISAGRLSRESTKESGELKVVDSDNIMVVS